MATAKLTSNRGFWFTIESLIGAGSKLGEYPFGHLACLVDVRAVLSAYGTEPSPSLVLNVSHSGDNVFDYWIEDTNHLAASPREPAGQVLLMLLESISLLPSDDDASG